MKSINTHITISHPYSLCTQILIYNFIEYRVLNILTLLTKGNFITYFVLDF